MLTSGELSLSACRMGLCSAPASLQGGDEPETRQPVPGVWESFKSPKGPLAMAVPFCSSGGKPILLVPTHTHRAFLPSKQPLACGQQLDLARACTEPSLTVWHTLRTATGCSLDEAPALGLRSTTHSLGGFPSLGCRATPYSTRLRRHPLPSHLPPLLSTPNVKPLRQPRTGRNQSLLH